MIRQLSSLKGILVPALFVAAWEAGFRAFVGTSDSLASPSAVVAAGVNSIVSGELALSTLQTLLSTCMGLAIGGGLGATIGLMLGLSPGAGAVVSTTVELLRPIPVIALVPLSTLIYGFGYRMEVSIIALATFWPCLILAQRSVAQIHSGLFDVARVLALGPVARFLKIIVPAAAPRLFLALRVGLGIAIIVAVTVEIVANPQGIGYFMMLAQESLRPADMLWGLVWVGTLGWGLNALLLRLEGRMFRGRAAVVGGAG
jgi:ABC-type nitrate/sulfonate/bicarbonate transport system permease component